MLHMDSTLLVVLVAVCCGCSSTYFYGWLFDFTILGNRRDLAIDTRQHGSVPGIYDNGGVYDAQAYGEVVEQWCSSVST